MLPLQADSDSDTTDRRQQNRQPKIETNVVIENNNNGNRTSDIIDDNDIKNEVINDNDINRNRNSIDQNIINNNSSSRAESPSPLPTPDLEEFSRQCFKLAADLSPDQDPKQHPLRALSESNLTVVSSFQGETGDQEVEQEVVIHEFIVALH